MQVTRFVVFWSAHGGVGRTLAVWSVGRILAEEGLRVLLVDLDLAAPGLSRLCGGEGEGLLELFEAPEEGEALARLCVPVAGLEGLRALPAGRLDAGYWDRLDAWTREDRSLELAALRRWIAEGSLADIVLVDAGGGLGRATERVMRALADHVVVPTALTQQHVAGTAELLRRCRDAGVGARVVPCLLPAGEDELAELREAAAREAWDEAWGAPVARSLSIPLHPRLALREQPHAAFARGPVYAAHVALARALLQDVGFERAALMDAVEAALGERQWARALALLRVAIAVDAGREFLAATVPWLREKMAPDPASDPVFALLAEALPVDSPRYPVLATGLHRAGNPLARRFYERFLAEEPDHADMLGNFAACLSDMCGEHELAEEYYQRALKADPSDADHLGNYANFLALVRRDPARADACYQATIAAAPEDAHHLGNYANFRLAAFDDLEGAEALYRRALAVEPDEPGLLGNFARALFAAGRDAEARELLARALADPAADPALRCELCFYALAHAPDLCPEALTQLRALLAAGVRSPGWDLRANVARVRREGHPQAELLATLAAVIADAAPLSALA